MARVLCRLTLNSSQIYRVLLTMNAVGMPAGGRSEGSFRKPEGLCVASLVRCRLHPGWEPGIRWRDETLCALRTHLASIFLICLFLAPFHGASRDKDATGRGRDAPESASAAKMVRREGPARERVTAWRGIRTGEQRESPRLLAQLSPTALWGKNSEKKDSASGPLSAPLAGSQFTRFSLLHVYT